jgi:hypothetical protein
MAGFSSAAGMPLMLAAKLTATNGLAILSY